MTHIVEAAAVQVRAGARVHFVERGALLPEGVDSAVIERLLAEKMISTIGASDEVDIPDGDPSEEWTAKQLDAYADAFSIDLGAAKTKPEKVAAITAAIASA